MIKNFCIKCNVCNSYFFYHLAVFRCQHWNLWFSFQFLQVWYLPMSSTDVVFTSMLHTTGSGCEESRFVCLTKPNAWRLLGGGFKHRQVTSPKCDGACGLLLWAWAVPTSLWVSQEWLTSWFPPPFRWIQQAIDLEHTCQDCPGNS